MPNPDSGFTGNEIVSRIVNFIGNQSSSFRTYVEQTLPLAQYRFCKMHDWGFLAKNGLSLTITQGTQNYSLNTASIGNYMAAEDVHSIFDPENGIYLERLNLDQIRRFDPNSDDGDINQGPTHWVSVGENQIKLYPPNFATGELLIDGMITPASFDNLATYPTIPYRYQESFIEYVLALALDRENDDRAGTKKAEALALIQQDIKADLRGLGNSINDRMRSMNELNPNNPWSPFDVD